MTPTTYLESLAPQQSLEEKAHQYAATYVDGSEGDEIE
jgi:hypothetical protein